MDSEPGLGDLVLRVRSDRYGTFEGRVEDLIANDGAHQFVVAFDGDEPQLPIGSEVDLELRPPGAAQPLQAPARVAARLRDDASHIYQFALFSGGGGAVVPLPFGRRRGLRVHLGSSVPARFALPGRRVEGQLEELSYDGAAALLPANIERVLGQQVRVRLSFRLPDAGTQTAAEGADLTPNPRFEFVADIRSRRLVQGMVRLGLDFLPPSGPAQTAQRERLATYVRARQVERLRWAFEERAD